MFLKLSKFFLYASVFAVVVVLPSTFFPFIGGKYYFFRVAVEMALASFILWWAFDPEGAKIAPQRLKELFRKPLVIAVSVFVGVFLLASIFAYDASAAFWSNYERGDGGFQMLHYYAFFVLLALLFREEKDWRKLFWLSLAAAILMILYGVLAAGFVPGFFGQYRAEDKPFAPSTLGRLFHPLARFQGSLGNPAYVAPYLMFSMFYALWLWWSGKSRRLPVALAYSGLLFVFLLFFMLSQTRGAFLGLGAAVVAFLAFAALKDEGQLRKFSIAALLVLVLTGGVLFSVRGADFLNNFAGGRLLDLNFGAETVQTRLWTWNSAWQGFKERPLLGWGPENFSAVFDRYLDPRHFVPGQNTETWFDRAHSIVFDYLAETGILGLAAFLGIWATFFWELLKKAQRGPVLKGLMLALPVGYLVQGLVLFDVLPIYMNVFIFLAFASHILYKNATAH